MGVDTANMKTPKFILRAVECLFAIITFSLVAEYTWSSKVDFTLFTGITTMLFTLTLLVLYAVGKADSPTLILVELVFNVIWWIFWLSTAAALSSIISDLDDYYGDANKYRASTAFAWMTFFLWSLSTFMSVKEVMHERNSSPGPANIPGQSVVV